VEAPYWNVILFFPTQNDQFSGKSPKKEKEKKKLTLMVPLLNTCGFFHYPSTWASPPPGYRKELQSTHPFPRQPSDLGDSKVALEFATGGHQSLIKFLSSSSNARTP
jgi:hypothetical protein